MTQTIGLPRGLLTYRYGTFWRVFFSELGAKVIFSPATTQQTAERGMALTVDEACLSLKLFFGHVDALVGKCDHIFIPRIKDLGRNRELCPRFSALYDMARNVFRDRGQSFLTCNIDVQGGTGVQRAYLALAQTLGTGKKDAQRAYREALKEAQRVWREKLRRQKALLAQDGLKILIVGHDYLAEDAYIGKPVTEFLKKSGAVPVLAGIVDREAALRRSPELSRTCKWQFNRELIGAIALYREKVDGVIFLSAFPCGPDAMVNELMLRRLDGMPLLQLIMDGQSGVAGTETRLESFLDIIRFQRGML